MCGIVGYIGNREAPEILIDGLRRLEYRGYDSAGVAVLCGETMEVVKSLGKVATLATKAETDAKHLWDGRAGIAHTRWATHGEPSEPNAHPHIDDDCRFAVVHNGIIENFAALREQLAARGHNLRSQTDSEVLPHLISEHYEGDLAEAVAAAVKQVEGTYGIAVLSLDNPEQLVAARKGSPIVLGLGEGETIIASDIAAIVSHTKRVIYLNDGELAVVTAAGADVRNLDNAPVSVEEMQVDWDVGAAEKGGFDHFMLKEIFEQPEALRNAIRGRLDAEAGTAVLPGLNMEPRDIAAVQRIIIAACGTSMYAGMVGEYYFEDLASIITEVEQAAEFRYRNPIVDERTLELLISQSGETADTLAALREGKGRGARVVGIVNTVGSTIAREAGCNVYINAGPEIGVASTKAFACQVVVMLMTALKFARCRRLSRDEGARLVADIEQVPALVETVLERAADIERIAKKWAGAENFFFIGRGYLYPVALEGALKLKEISYVHAEGYQAAELKHGPIALLEERVPVVALATDIPGKDKTIGNIQECMARKSPVIIAATDGDEEVTKFTDDIIWIPPCSVEVSPIPTVVAMQLLSYYVARERGCSIDQPRNLAKSVTVE